ncbi:MAG: hypothetical protein HZA08_09885 [Nitrospirae bacterium]|nr:hypothetical protein [Nitrospirota bacterium]
MVYPKIILIFFFLFVSISSVFASSPTFRIEIEKEGIYTIGYETLYAALTKSGYTSADAVAFLTTIKTQTLLMNNRGEEIPIFVSDYGHGQFSFQDYIVFYGTGITGTLDSEHRFTNEYRYTKTNVYYLTTGDEQDRIRIKGRDGKPVNGTPADMFLEKYHGEQDTRYWEGLPDGDGRDHWFWDSKIYGGEGVRTFPSFDLKNKATTNRNILLRYSLQGRTDDFAVNPDHHVQIFLNDQLAGDESWDGIWADEENKQLDLTHEVTKFNQSLLKSSGNVIKINSIGVPDIVKGMGASCIGETDSTKICDAIYLNYFDIEYYKKYTADKDELRFSSPSATGAIKYNISNMSSGDAEIYDITDPSNIYRITGAIYDSTNKTLSFSDEVQDKKAYIALTLSARNKNIPPVKLAGTHILTDTDNQADYIIITHEDFMDAAEVLALHREGKGLKTKVVNIKDVYEEFNYGIVTPNAIKDFLDYAYHSWTPPAPMYVLLLGDANLDAHDNWGYQKTNGDKNFIPVKMVQSNIAGVGEIPSDNWYVTLKNKDGKYDIFPDMFIGRITAKTGQEASNIVNKIIAQETPLPMEWTNRLLFISGNSYAKYDPDYSNPTFVKLADDLSTFIPPGFESVKLYADYYREKDPAMKTDIINKINEGVSLITFIGHGSVSEWYAIKQPVFISGDVANLSNPGRYPFVLALNCLNGIFPFPAEGITGGFEMPLGESLLKELDRGAYGVWTVTAFGFASDYVPLSKEFFTNIFRRKNLILGSATTNAKISAVTGFGKNPENLDVLILLGDPASSMNIDVPDVSNTVGDGSTGGTVPADKKPQSGGCFIATAAFGSPLSPYVEILREFRDTTLLKYSFGKRFVDFYYMHSPPIAGFIEQHEYLKLPVRLMLVPVIGIAWLMMHIKLYYSMLLLFLFKSIF